jgi:MFS transporter, PAT family, solute carrier family 33 (acetyl-CoA transportor), member 1
VDSFTQATCHPGSPDQKGLKGALITEAFSCAIQSEKERCVAGGGTCEILKDGYYVVNVICVLFGVVTFFMYIRPRVLHLQALPLKAWRLAPWE